MVQSGADDLAFGGLSIIFFLLCQVQGREGDPAAQEWCPPLLKS